MTNKIRILEKVEAIRPQGICDDCLSELLKISKRQQVNQICNSLARQERLLRKKGPCMQGCEKTSQYKWVNFTSNLDEEVSGH
ncbi:MAG: hypothetical protein WCJ37_03910 [Syntrophus sp. (in: bacteria)]